jgi:hypothetical protein
VEILLLDVPFFLCLLGTRCDCSGFFGLFAPVAILAAAVFVKHALGFYHHPLVAIFVSLKLVEQQAAECEHHNARCQMMQVPLRITHVASVLIQSHCAPPCLSIQYSFLTFLVSG